MERMARVRRDPTNREVAGALGVPKGTVDCGLFLLKRRLATVYDPDRERTGMTELLLASNNEHKHAEFARLFPGVRIVRPREIGVAFDFPEDGATFLANALGKARALYAIARRPVIGDDSGLCVAALGGAPGVHSARYGSDGRRAPGGRRAQRAAARAPRRRRRPARVLRLLPRAGASTTTGSWSCRRPCTARSRDAPRGAHGFGYDPLFLLPDRGLTIAELPDAEKDLVSHRGRAARRLRVMLDGVT